MDADADESDLRSRLAIVQERLDRYTLRFTAGYGSDGDRAHWLGWLRQLRAQRDELERTLAAVQDRAGDDLAAGGGSG
ncbi:MAG TPA: hypothetical protein VFK54_10550 [Candidatus Limnocylindrales bacterium]|nr:hypothetical protein [Candidatus Limnocylindrales bacterium]